MKQFEPETDWWTIAVSVVLFLVAAWLTDRYQGEIEVVLADQGWLAVGVYLAIMIGQVIFAPINPAPLVPLASATWGPPVAALITLVGWTVGSLVVFVLVHRFGLALVARVLSERRILQLQRIVPTLWSVVALRLLVPIDLVSYALGFVPGLRLRDYVVGTAVGYLPYALLYAYLGETSLPWQLLIIGLVVGMVVLLSPRWFLKIARSR